MYCAEVIIEWDCRQIHGDDVFQVYKHASVKWGGQTLEFSSYALMSSGGVSKLAEYLFCSELVLFTINTQYLLHDLFLVGWRCQGPSNQPINNSLDSPDDMVRYYVLCRVSAHSIAIYACAIPPPLVLAF